MAGCENCDIHRAENRRLREALSRLIDNIETGSYESTGQAVDEARAALAGKVEG